MLCGRSNLKWFFDTYWVAVIHTNHGYCFRTIVVLYRLHFTLWSVIKSSDLSVGCSYISLVPRYQILQYIDNRCISILNYTFVKRFLYVSLLDAYVNLGCFTHKGLAIGYSLVFLYIHILLLNPAIVVHSTNTNESSVNSEIKRFNHHASHINCAISILISNSIWFTSCNWRETANFIPNKEWRKVTLTWTRIKTWFLNENNFLEVIIIFILKKV